MKNKLKKLIPLVAIPSIIALSSSCDSNTPLGQQNNILGNAEFTIPLVLSPGDVVEIKSFLLTRPLELTLTIQSPTIMTYFDAKFPSGLAPIENVEFTYIPAAKTRILEFTIYKAIWDTIDTNGTTTSTPEMPDPTVDDFNVLEGILKDVVANDVGVRTAAVNYANLTTRESAQILYEALMLNATVRSEKMVFDLDGEELRVFKSVTAILQIDGSSNFTRVGVPLDISATGQITRSLGNTATDTVSSPTGFTYTAAGDVVAE